MMEERDTSPATSDDGKEVEPESAHANHRMNLAEVRRIAREKKKKQREENPDASDEDDDKQLIDGLLRMGVSLEQPAKYEGTGFIYDEKMTEHRNLWDDTYPECPERLTESFQRCSQLGLVERCTRIEARHGTEDQVLLQHSEEILEKLKSAALMNSKQLKELSSQYDSVYLHQSSYESALLAVGSTMELMEQILKKKIRNGMALIRPPGHHAMHNEFCGYCYFNNVGIAAKHAVDNLGLKRVLIVDWDVHHGQATQQMFYNDPRVLYFSIHRYEYGNFWPNLRESDYDYIGDGDGKGYNVNVPLNETKMTDSDYLAIFHQLLMPIAFQFDPELVLVSAGYDAAIGCPEGEMLVTPVAFAHFTHHLMSLAEGRLCVCLEGGYCLKTLAEGVALSLRSLLGDPCPVLAATKEPSNGVTTSILNVIKVLQPHWSCFQYQSDLEEGELCLFEEILQMPPKPGVEFATKENRPETFSVYNEIPQEIQEEYIKRRKYDVTIAEMIAETCLAKAPHKVGLMYDEGMRAHKAVLFYDHPESPERITSIFDRHSEWGLLDRCHRVRSRVASDAELLAIHSSSHIEEMNNLAEKTLPELRSEMYKYNSIYLCPETNMCARLAAGSVLNVTDKVLSGQTQSGVAIVRPPGHHAECTKPMGFCFYNNVAIAAKYAQNSYGLKRILILDWDVHHGNGTQHSFYEDPNVLFICLHRYENGLFYPSSTDGDCTMVGEEAGKGFNVNIPWNDGPMGDAEYIAAFQQIVMPIAYQFAPELVLVSAGFDAAMGDPLGGYQITPTGYGHMTHMLSSLANGKVIVILEGGYNLTSISHSMATCTSVLLGDCCPHMPYTQPNISAIDCIRDVIDVQKDLWDCLKFKVSIPWPEGVSKPDEDDQSDDNEKSGKDNSVENLTKQLKNVSVEENNQQDGGAQAGGSGASGGAAGGMARPPGQSELTKHTLVQDLEEKGVEKMFAVEPKPWCCHLETVRPLPNETFNVSAPCESCGDTSENWVCLVCYKIYCSRYVNEHMLMHGIEASHLMSLSFSDLSVWCYGCDDYIDNQLLVPAKKAAYRSKFRTEMPGV